MKKLFIVLSLFATTLIGITSISALSQGQSLTDAERFLKGIGYNPTQNDIELQANAFFFAFRQGSRGNIYDPNNEYVVDLIVPGASQALIDLEITMLTTYYREGLVVFARNQNPIDFLEIGINNPQVAELVSQAAAIAYANGFQQGITNTTGTSVNALTSFVPQLLGVGFGFFLQVASVEVLGISLLSIVALMVTLSGTLITIKVMTGGR